MTSAPNRTADAVLVADVLSYVDREPISCPAAPLLVGELHRRGVSTVCGPLWPDSADRHARTVSSVAVVPGSAGPSGLGVAARTPASAAVARTALAACLRATCRRRTVLLAAPRAFCAGVERAVEIVERLIEHRGPPVYVRRQIVHNASVVADLAARGAVFVEELDAVPAGSVVVFSAHGVAPAVRADAVRRGLEVVDATCPLVTKVHTEARRFAARGDTVVLVGHAGHEEVVGTMGEAERNTVLVENVADAQRLRVPDPARVSYLTQTTLARDETTEIINALRARFPKLRGPASDDICYASTNRQDALATIAGEADLVLVIGSANSANSGRLVELTRRAGTPAVLIDGPDDIRPEWLVEVGVLGLTAGASAPPHIIGAVLDALGGLGPISVSERETVSETMRFTLPLAVRS
jgi:4-hydroxy-3-methylbut-2-enyl diphosphate reductase